MTPDQLKELERLNERWANDPKTCPGSIKAEAISTEVMDLLPDVLSHIKQLSSECDSTRRELVAHREKANGNYWAWQGDGGDHLESLVCPVLISAKALQQLTAERDAALRALHEEKEYSEALAKDICDMEDALGFKNDCTDKDGAFIPTKGPWIERVRDLIAKEGELGDCKSELDAANAKCADLQLIIDGLNVGYHADSEWQPVLMVLEDIATDDLDRVSGGVKQSAQQALAIAEKLMKAQ